MSFEPISPMQLHRAGMLNDLVIPKQGFDIKKDWTNSYLLIATWGQSYKDIGYQYVYGHLTIEKRTENDQTSLSINKEILTKDKTLMRTDASILVGSDGLLPLLKWQKDTVLMDDEGVVIDEASLSEKGELSSGILSIEKGQIKKVKSTHGPVTDFWCVMASVQNLEPEFENYEGFTMLQHLNILRRNQSLYRHEDEISIDGKSVDRIYQIGDGTLPTDYWRTSDGRLLYVTSGNLAWVFNQNAKDRFNEMRRKQSYEFKS